MSHRTIDPVDTIWLNMDRDNNLMVIESLMTFDGPVDWERFLAVYERRVVDRFPVFRQRPVWSGMPFATPRWYDDEDFDLQRHVRYATLDAPGDDAALQDYIGSFVSRPLHRDRPLWQVHLIDGYEGGSAVYSRLHHALADGIALTRVLLSLVDDSPGADLADPVEPVERPHGALALADVAGGAASALGHTLGHALLELPHLLTPGHAVDALSATRQATEVAAKLLLAKSPHGPLSGVPGVPKRVLWGTPYPLADIVAVGKATGTTVNDVLVAALSGALAAYSAEQGVDPIDTPTMVPVNVRPPDKPLPRELGNQFALVLLSLPSGLRTPFERLAETHRRMEEIKHSPEAWLTFGMIQGIGRTGPEIERFLVNFFAGKATGVTTNVPGPRSTVYVAGSRVRSLLGWAPGSGNQTLETSLFTYDGFLHVGFKVDVATISEPERLVELFEAELAELGRLVVPRKRAARRTTKPRAVAGSA